MWARVEDENVIEIIPHPKPITVDEISHPRAIFTAWTDADRRNIGIYTVQQAEKLDARFYIPKNPTYAVSGTDVIETIEKSADKELTDTNDVDENGDPVLDDHGNQTVTLGLKSKAKLRADVYANRLLHIFDWLVQRKVTADTAIPSDVTTYMAAVRTAHASICTAIDNASDLDAFIVLHTDEYNEDGTLKTVRKVNDWPDDYAVKSFRR